MVKTALGGDEREPDRNYEDPYAPKPKPSMDWFALQRAQEFIDVHFNDRRNKDQITKGY